MIWEKDVNDPFHTHPGLFFCNMAEAAEAEELVTFEHLALIEDEFDDIDTEIR